MSKKFEAILSKNRIAREIADFKRNGSPMLIDVLIEDLKAIEAVIGQGNQPTIESIIENNSAKDRKFRI